MNRDLELFTEALSVPPRERAALLDRLAGGDVEMRKRVEALLAAHSMAGDFMERPAAARPMLGPEEKAGDVIDHYVLARKLGEGGAGAVWLAEQREPVRRMVALKVIKLGMDTRQIVARFEAERQALALMDHPDIAKVFDAGATSSGRPYFVMEYVNGEPITRFCDSRQLPMNERLELFARVCQAVQHAHQKGLIHRDLKPSNILVSLVDGIPAPKVIDFGIAKAIEGRLTEATAATALEQFIGTPAYMSPEQAQLNGDIDTRSDIYSLGVLLYELLTGRPPFEPEMLLRTGFDEMRRYIREVEPPRPSTRLTTLEAGKLALAAERRDIAAPRLVGLVQGDLDWIVMRCLEKDRSRRYDSAAGLAQDLRRHLDHEPVEARPASAWYRLQKLVRRNRLACAAAAAVALALLGGLSVSAWQAARARRAERHARQEALIATAVSDFLGNDILRQADSTAQAESLEDPNPDIKVRDALDRAAAKVGQRFAGQPLTEAAVRQAIAEAYLGLGLAAKAEPQLLRASQLRAKEAGVDDRSTLAVRSLLGRCLSDEGKFAEAASLQKALIATEGRLEGPEDPVVLGTMNDLADTYFAEGKYKEAEGLQRRTLSIRTRVLGPEQPATIWSMSNLGNTYYSEHKLDDAARTQLAALALRRKVLGPDHPGTLNTQNNLAETYQGMGKYDEAAALEEKTLESERRVLGPEHPQTLAEMINLAETDRLLGKTDAAMKLLLPAVDGCRRILGPDNPMTVSALNALANEEVESGDFAAGAATYRQLLDELPRVFGPDHPNVIGGTINLASATLKSGKPEEARALLTGAEPKAIRLLGAEDPITLALFTNLASVDEAEGRLADAIGLRSRAYEAQRRVYGPEHPITTSNMSVLATDLLDNGQYVAAEPVLTALLAARTKLAPDQWTTFNTRCALGRALVGQKRFSEAEPLLEGGYAGMISREDKIPAEGRIRIVEALEGLVAASQGLGQTEKAATWNALLEKRRVRAEAR